MPCRPSHNNTVPSEPREDLNSNLPEEEFKFSYGYLTQNQLHPNQGYYEKSERTSRLKQNELGKDYFVFDPAIPILEKALAKLAGSYQKLYENLDKDALIWILGSITGAQITEKKWGKISSLEAFELWDTMSDNFKAGNLLLATMKSEHLKLDSG